MIPKISRTDYEAHRIRFVGGTTCVAQVDIVVPAQQYGIGEVTNSDITATGGAKERAVAAGCVVGTGGVVMEHDAALVST
jgi:hypothetical protein